MRKIFCPVCFQTDTVSHSGAMSVHQSPLSPPSAFKNKLRASENDGDRHTQELAYHDLRMAGLAAVHACHIVSILELVTTAYNVHVYNFAIFTWKQVRTLMRFHVQLLACTNSH